MYPVSQQTPPSTYDAMPPVMPPAMPPVQPPMQAPEAEAQKPTDTPDLENGLNVEDLNVPKNIKDIKGSVRVELFVV